MKYKEFLAWCNDRACDGCWSMQTAIYCMDTLRRINKLPFWKRRKAWKEIREYIETNIVSVIDAKIQAMKGDMDNDQEDKGIDI